LVKVMRAHRPAEDLRRGWVLPADQVALEFSHHSLRRFAERLGVDEDEAKRAVIELVRTGFVAKRAPAGVNDDHARRPKAFLFDDEVVMPLFRNRGRPGSAPNGTRKDVFITGTALTRQLMAETALEMVGDGVIRIGTIGNRTGVRRTQLR
jgi:hypothetical protein